MRNCGSTDVVSGLGRGLALRLGIRLGLVIWLGKRVKLINYSLITVFLIATSADPLFTHGHVWNESSPFISLTGTEVPGHESSKERKFQGTKVPPIELSLLGTNFLWYESSS